VAGDYTLKLVQSVLSTTRKLNIASCAFKQVSQHCFSAINRLMQYTPLKALKVILHKFDVSHYP